MVMFSNRSGSLHGVFSQITGSEEEVVRDRAIKFLSTKLVPEIPQLNLSPAAEETLIAESKKVVGHLNDI